MGNKLRYTKVRRHKIQINYNLELIRFYRQKKNKISEPKVNTNKQNIIINKDKRWDLLRTKVVGHS